MQPDRTASGEPVRAIGRAPGRVELLGNHTDYNGGLVLAAAVDRETTVIGTRTPGRTCVVRSSNFHESITIDLDRLDAERDESWGRYVRGVLWALAGRFGPLKGGFEATIDGRIPLGAGLSSSAGLQASVALFALAAGLVDDRSAELDDESRMALAQTLRRSENEYVGVSSGLLDQFSSLFGRADTALFLDCRTLEYARVPFATPAPTIVICDSKTSRRLADGLYNERFAECRRVVDHFRSIRPGASIELLRDLTLDDLHAEWGQLDPVARRRARHVLTENDRVREGVEALKRGDSAEFGRLMSRSHDSSRDDFENSSPALDALIDSAESAPGFLGGKLSGAGWAGCTVNLVSADLAEAFSLAVNEGYARRTGRIPEIHICRAADGASGARMP
jgi:galactokinase